MHRQGVAVMEACDRLDLAKKELGGERGGELLLKHLQGHWLQVLRVLRKVQRGHTAPAGLALDLVAVSQGGLQAGSVIVQAGSGNVAGLSNAVGLLRAMRRGGEAGKLPS